MKGHDTLYPFNPKINKKLSKNKAMMTFKKMKRKAEAHLCPDFYNF